MTDRLRLVLGVKLRQLRQERGETLSTVAKAAGVSVSYLSEIEKGKKYPAPEKMVGLAHALGVAYDDLVSLKVDPELEGLREVIYSPFLKAFPFALFGVERQDVVRLMAGVPKRSGALLRAFLEVSRTYDARVEHFLFAALRSYQQMHSNRFPKLERAAADFRAARGWDARWVPDAAELRVILEREHGYTIDTETLEHEAGLDGFRSVLVEGARPTLLVHGDLRDEQQAFLYARELGLIRFQPEVRPTTGSWLKVESFEQVLANFEASYFAGAVLLPADGLDDDLRAFFARPAWDEGALRRALARWRATPEMYGYRLGQRIPDVFGLEETFFMRFHNDAGSDRYTLTKVLNLSEVPVPHGIRLDEHYCRRWAGMVALRTLTAQQADGAADAVSRGDADGDLVVTAQRAYFVDEKAEFFIVAMARPLSLNDGANSVVMLGFRVDRAFKRAVRFWDDPAVPLVEVGLTCERCPIADCAVRAAPPTVLEEKTRQAEQEAALAALRARIADG